MTLSLNNTTFIVLYIAGPPLIGPKSKNGESDPPQVDLLTLIENLVSVMGEKSSSVRQIGFLSKKQSFSRLRSLHRLKHGGCGTSMTKVKNQTTTPCI